MFVGLCSGRDRLFETALARQESLWRSPSHLYPDIPTTPIKILTPYKTPNPEIPNQASTYSQTLLWGMGRVGLQLLGSHAIFDYRSSGL